jgi:hypothetical protein
MKRLEEYITEYVSSGRGNPKKWTPSKDIDSVVDWLKMLGVDDFKKWNGSLTYAPTNGIIAEIGPCRKNDKGTFWVAIHNNPSSYKDRQRIIARPYIESEVEYYKGHIKEITFDEAMILMKEMISDPTKPIDER